MGGRGLTQDRHFSIFVGSPFLLGEGERTKANKCPFFLGLFGVSSAEEEGGIKTQISPAFKCLSRIDWKKRGGGD